MAEEKACRNVEGEKTAIIKAIGNPSSANTRTLYYDLARKGSNENLVTYWVEWSAVENPSYVTRRSGINSLRTGQWKFVDAAEAIKILEEEFDGLEILYCRNCKSGQQKGPCRC